MAFPDTLVIATRNPHKVREIKEICADWPVRVLDAVEGAAWPDVKETGASYLENALLKARAVNAAFSVPALSDDSGIEVEALGWGPGIRSARYAGEDATDEENLAALMRAMQEVPRERRLARYRCVAALVWPGGEEVWAEGTCEGTIVASPRGSGGFGYDPVFAPEGSAGRTFAQMTSDEKNALSHRGRAFRALAHRLPRG